jgi:hypothetical protein
MGINHETRKALTEALAGAISVDQTFNWYGFYCYINQMYQLPNRPTEAELYIELGEMGRLELADQLVPVYTHGIGILDAGHF